MMSISLKEMEMKLKENDDVEKWLALLRKDERKGAQKLLLSYERQLKREALLEEMHQNMVRYESQARANGASAIAGVDEVGRGPLAGPVVASAVILPTNFKLLGLTDSKKLSKAKREEFAKRIKEEAIAYSVSMVHAAEIDEINIYESTKKAMCQALALLDKHPDHVLVDAMTLPLEISQTSIIKGDQKSISIAASSIIAKVARDQYMEELGREYPHYGFANNAGYGTKEHLHALKVHGVTIEHRKSFQPVADLLVE
ncbi:ribonuclease HII [Bacillus sp. JCM 19034]|uniref:ribonuclease HII n=1 Tax=Bacillus sp. JCM 19034 TaxID=1481928 RepID=UPI000783C0B3|nr:ribonuclease HII [Bacillus sp. JCM 19034]